MEIYQHDKHLNLFHFFSDGNNPFYEDNLTRAFSICLQNDPILFEKVLNDLIGVQPKSLMKESRDTNQITIDIQKNVSEIESCEKLIGIALTTDEQDLLKYTEPRNRTRHITDLMIRINDLVIIVEVKKTGENCIAQLKGQIEELKNSNLDSLESDSVQEKEITWVKVISTMEDVLMFQKNTNSVNKFTKDFVEFIERKHPNWFGTKPLSMVEFSKNGKNKHLIDCRIEEYKKVYYGEEELVHNRNAISLKNIDWADELNIRPIRREDGVPFIALEIAPGDTKQQGWKLFKNTNDGIVDWPDSISYRNEKYSVQVHHNIKFAHYGRGLFWVRSQDKKRPKTHTKDFFKNYTGRWKRIGDSKKWKKKDAEWGRFKELVEALSTDKTNKKWTDNEIWVTNFVESGKSYFDVSVGFLIRLMIPYSEIQKWDSPDGEGLKVAAKHINSIAKKYLSELDGIVKS